MLRKVRREGLSPEQLAALGGSSRLDDSEARQSDSASARARRRRQGQDRRDRAADGRRARLRPSGRRALGLLQRAHRAGGAGALGRCRRRRRGVPLDAQREDAAGAAAAAGLGHRAAPTRRRRSFAAPACRRWHRCRWPTRGRHRASSTHRFAVEVSEVVHDPELDEAVIAFANADFNQCEQALSQLTGAGGARAQHAETWLVLFDLYRATGQQQRFESLALDYAHQFGWSAPQWYLAAQAGGRCGGRRRRCRPQRAVDRDRRRRRLGLPRAARHRRRGAAALADAADAAALGLRLGRAAQHRCRGGDAAVDRCSATGASRQLEMRWMAGEHLFAVLQEAAPTGVRDADPAFWQARLDALRLANRADQFDEAAIDYCVTYEVSPPSWERDALQGAHQRLQPEHAHAAAVDGQRGVDRASWSRGLVDDTRQRRAGGERRAVGPAGRRHQRHAGPAERAAGQRRRWSACRARG